jgi:hypothetical protein
LYSDENIYLVTGLYNVGKSYYDLRDQKKSKNYLNDGKVIKNTLSKKYPSIIKSLNKIVDLDSKKKKGCFSN